MHLVWTACCKTDTCTAFHRYAVVHVIQDCWTKHISYRIPSIRARCPHACVCARAVRPWYDMSSCILATSRRRFNQKNRNGCDHMVLDNHLPSQIRLDEELYLFFMYLRLVFFFGTETESRTSSSISRSISSSSSSSQILFVEWSSSSLWMNSDSSLQKSLFLCSQSSVKLQNCWLHTMHFNWHSLWEKVDKY